MVYLTINRESVAEFDLTDHGMAQPANSESVPFPCRHANRPVFKASPGNVNATSEGHFATVGEIQRIDYSILPSRAWIQALLIHIWC